MKLTRLFPTDARFIPIAVALLLGAIGACAQNTLVTYQGLVTDHGTNFTGTGQFKFVLVTTNGGTTSWWSNDGSSANGSQPTAGVSAGVTNGLFTIALGNTALPNMSALPLSVFSESSLQLLIWFNDGANGFAQLNPAQNLTAAPYAAALLGPLTASQLSSSGNADGGRNNFFIGSAGNSNVTGSFNTANGASALEAVTTGSRNTANGALALEENTSGNYNVATGEGALLKNTTGSANTANGTLALFSNTNGSFNTANGYEALFSNTTGSDNTANGYQALYANNTGTENTAIGFDALYDATNGVANTAAGFEALADNTSGNNNTAIGAQALQYNSTGYANTAEGSGALYANTTGYDNTANGDATLSGNTTGYGNTADGFQALYSNTTGFQNTANGFGTLYSNTNGSANLALGAYALASLTSGQSIIALGFEAGADLNSGSDDIYIGHLGVDGEAGVIRIGSALQTNTYIAGIWGNTIPGGAAVYVNSAGQLGTATSSARYKQNIQPMGETSDVLLSLKPVTFEYKPSIDPAGTAQFGLIAEEVERVDPNLVVHDSEHGIYTVRYEAVNAMLLNEFLKQHRQVEEQSAELQELKARLEKLERLAAPESRGTQ